MSYQTPSQIDALPATGKQLRTQNSELITALGVLAIGILVISTWAGPVAPAAGAGAQTPIITTRPTSTYRVSFSVACGGSGDCVTLFASPSSLVRVREVWISKPSGAITVAIIKRSAADTGGTSSALTAVKFRSDAGAATATTLAYTVAPTAGTSAGTLISQSMATTDTLVQDFGTLNDQALTLESASEGLAINVSGAVTLTGYIEWTEP